MARSFARGAPPPPGSFEYVMVADHWDPEIYHRKYGRSAGAPGSAPWAGVSGRGGDEETDRTSRSGFQFYELSFTDLDAANNYAVAVDRAVKQARRLHGDRILSRDDERRWDEHFAKWRTFVADMHMVPGSPEMMVRENKKTFDELVNETKKLHDEFAKKGMSEVPVPYAGELVVLLRTMPKRMTAAQISAKLLAGAKCGDRMLDENTTWWSWVRGRDHLPLRAAVIDARKAADIFARSRDSTATYAPGDPVYDEFLRRLTKIWIEAAGLYGINQTKATAAAEFKDAVREMPKTFAHYALGLLALAGVSYLGVRWIVGREDVEAPHSGGVAVPDAYPIEGE